MIYTLPRTAKRITDTAGNSEAREQSALITWANQCAALGIYPELQWLHAIPNGVKRNKIEAAHLKAQGVKSGVPDLFLPVPKGDYHGLYIEMKVDQNKPTENQIKWLSALSSFGYAVQVCYSAKKARAIIEWYLSLKTSEIRGENYESKNAGIYFGENEKGDQ